MPSMIPAARAKNGRVTVARMSFVQRQVLCALPAVSSTNSSAAFSSKSFARTVSLSVGDRMPGRAVSRTRMFEAVLVRMRADSNRFCAVAGSVSSKPSTTIDAPRPRRQADPSCLSTASSSVCPSTSRALSHTGKGAFPSVIRSLIPVRCQVSAVSDLPDPKSPSITTTSPGMTSGTSIRPKCRSRAVSSTSNDCRRTVRRASERCCSTRARSFELKAAPGPACWRSASRTVTFRC
ncbi:hypothetical protein ACFFX0_22810 [Citricoccus parietis]|uniref:Uncharacterized protein n=1 Tax=Citricoccus parietis TaxID=592307 RepID=A0ABV5G4K6_9MICC